MAVGSLVATFLLGLATPLTAVCVLPLYPGFLAYLSSQLSGKENRRGLIFSLGLLITVGVLLFMFLLGLIFTTLLQVSLTKIIGLVSPIAFVILALLSLLLILNLDVGQYLPKAHTPFLKNPWLSAFLFGFFFGAIVIPCNPIFIAALFTTAITGLSFAQSMLHFVFFGVGIAFPLLLFSALSTVVSQSVISFITKYKMWINRIAGIIMLIISLYYLIFVFHVFG